MPWELGEPLTHWTARLAVGACVVRLLMAAGLPAGPRRERSARGVWTAGWGLYLLHVACAFHFVHGWSHQAAWEHTARQTASMAGLDWGGGLWFNHAFTALWTADVAAWWLRGAERRRSRRIAWSLHAFFAFMLLNATVVFGPPFWRWAAVAVAIVLAALALARRLRGR